MNSLLALSFPTFAGITGLILVIAGFSFLIFVHELGHFLVARWVNIKVTQFAIGIGPGILAWRKGMGFRLGSTEPEYERRIREKLTHDGPVSQSAAAGDKPAEISSARISEVGRSLGLSETEYRLNWLPLGGYVKMEGQEDMDPTARSDDARAFNNKPAWARAAVISAGVIMNMIFAVIFFIIAFMAGVNFPAPEIGLVAPNGPAARAVAVGHEDDPAYLGLKPGDRFISIDGEPVHDFADVSVRAGLARAGDALSVMVERGAELLTYRVTPEKGPEELMWMGISAASLPKLADTGKPEDLPALLREAGVRPGMTITRADDLPIERVTDLRDAIDASRGRPVTLLFQGDSPEQEVSLTIHPRAMLTDLEDDVRGLLGMVPPAEIGAVVPRSPAEKAGLKEGDVVARLGPLAWPDPLTIFTEVPRFRGTELPVEVLRVGRRETLKPIKPDGKGKIGVVPLSAQPAIVGRTLPGSPAAAANLPPGSRIISIADQPVETWNDVQRVLQDAAGGAPAEAVDDAEPLLTIPVTFELALAEHPRETYDLALGKTDLDKLREAQWAMGEMVAFMPKEVTLVAKTPWEAIALGIHRTHIVMVQTYQTLARLFQGSVPAKALRGPVGIADIGTQIVTNKGWTFLMFFLGLISVNLAVLNFLPLPIVDGGLMVFLLIEKIKGSPVSPAVLTAANVIGLALLGSLFLFVTFHDISRLVTGG